MPNLGIYYCGLLIPIAVTLRLFRRDSTPTRGACGDCGVPQELTYALWDGTRECRECIKFLVESNWLGVPMREPQAHPEKRPVEGVSIPPLAADLSVYEAAFA